MDDTSEGDVLFEGEVTIHAAVEGMRCVVCRQRIIDGDKVRVNVQSGHAPPTFTHVGCLDAVSL
jgi:hypothetical protein